jgi:hypothetical protein
VAGGGGGHAGIGPDEYADQARDESIGQGCEMGIFRRRRVLA